MEASPHLVQGALEEVDWLRTKLERLEQALLGESAMHLGGGQLAAAKGGSGGSGGGNGDAAVLEAARAAVAGAAADAEALNAAAGCGAGQDPAEQLSTGRQRTHAGVLDGSGSASGSYSGNGSEALEPRQAEAEAEAEAEGGAPLIEQYLVASPRKMGQQVVADGETPAAELEGSTAAEGPPAGSPLEAMPEAEHQAAEPSAAGSPREAIPQVDQQTAEPIEPVAVENAPADAACGTLEVPATGALGAGAPPAEDGIATTGESVQAAHDRLAHELSEAGAASGGEDPEAGADRPPVVATVTVGRPGSGSTGGLTRSCPSTLEGGHATEAAAPAPAAAPGPAPE